jgi:hypothetical protein
MIKTYITPQDTDLHIPIPQDYVGKKLEVILFSVEETEIKPTPKKKINPSDFAGTLSKKNAAALLKHVEESRKEWERDI